MCEGIAAFSHTREDWHLTLYEDGLPAALRNHHGARWFFYNKTNVDDLACPRPHRYELKVL